MVFILFGWIFLNVIECLKFRLCLNFNGMVLFWVRIFGSFFMVVVILVGMLIIVLVIFSCLFVGFYCNCINGIFGV